VRALQLVRDFEEREVRRERGGEAARAMVVSLDTELPRAAHALLWRA
tara:strand:+ start:413 stop:553 length:141 start_codon:yes stop_codon:yes gene_type:complete